MIRLEGPEDLLLLMLFLLPYGVCADLLGDPKVLFVCLSSLFGYLFLHFLCRGKSVSRGFNLCVSMLYICLCIKVLSDSFILVICIHVFFFFLFSIFR